MAILASLVGLAGGFAAIGFRFLIELIQSLSFGSKGDLLELAYSLPWYWKVCVPALGGLVVGPLVYFFAREAKGHGVPEVMESVALRSGIIRKRVVIVKSMASAISIGTGGSVGREGPIVQIGSAIGSSIGQLLRVSADRIRTLVGCGAAAGIAATFNAPIAGAMFALEIILGDFGLATFSPIVISSVTATAVSRHFLGNFPAFQVPSYQLVSAWELPLYVLLGLFCSLVAVTFTTTLYKVEDLFDRVRFPEYLKAVGGGLILGLMALLFPHILGVGYPAINLALLGKLSWGVMLLLVVFKIMATSITIGSGGSGGIFAPSLFLGSMAGGFFGTVVHSLLPGITASVGAYSIVGMAGVVSGTTHGPMSAILILFEMTGNYRIILPVMIACIISSVASGQLLKDSIYTLKLARRGVNIKAGKEVNILKSMRVKEAMNPEVDTIPENLSLGSLAEKISRSKYNSFPIVDASGSLTGMLSYVDYHDVVFDENLVNLVVAKELATQNVVTVSTDDSLYTALERITAKDFSILPVVSSYNPKQLLGVLTRRDIMAAYNKAVIRKSVLNA
ncbi:MAG: chloride channel protein [Desulfobacterales bacterium]|nr:chloride channel protein [Desulfobacterales bacterium]